MTPDPAHRPVLLVVIGSTRPGRVGLPVATWFADRARTHGTFDVHVADLAEVDLPLLDEPFHPRLQRYQHDHTKAWSATAAAADAFAFVAPEYNHGIAAPLKNALDYLGLEWRHKPAGLVSYGGVSAGLRAAAQLKQVLAALQVVPVGAAVSIPFVGQKLEDGALVANEVMEKAATAMLEDLARWHEALRGLRAG
ncbi:MAG: NAD(P)H-dependent oxidoreductase [Trueperaceae bacterium]|nr:NAD(P)H-dependent oxidoreductase [Trueperaceae bacterium]